jgi:hypothetical protein
VIVSDAVSSELFLPDILNLLRLTSTHVVGRHPERAGQVTPISTGDPPCTSLVFVLFYELIYTAQVTIKIIWEQILNRSSTFETETPDPDMRLYNVE